MKLITGIIIFIVFLSFGVGVWFAWYYTFKDIQGPPGMPQFVSYFVSSVNGLLVANLGAIIGVSVYLSSFDWMKSNPGKTQIIAAGYYLLIFVVATIAWSKTGFSEKDEEVVPVLSEITKSGTGILIAFVASALGVEGFKRMLKKREE